MDSEEAITRRRFFFAKGIVTVSAVLGTVMAVSTQSPVENKIANYACDDYEVQWQCDDSFNSPDTISFADVQDGEESKQSNDQDVIAISTFFNWLDCLVVCDSFDGDSDSFDVTDFLKSRMVRGPPHFPTENCEKS